MGRHILTLSTGSATSGESDESCFDSVYVVWYQMVERSRTCLRPHFQMPRGSSRSENRPLGEQTGGSEPPVALTWRDAIVDTRSVYFRLSVSVTASMGIGVSRSRLPMTVSIALNAAGGTPMVGLSPTPFAPCGRDDGVLASLIET